MERKKREKEAQAKKNEDGSPDRSGVASKSPYRKAGTLKLNSIFRPDRLLFERMVQEGDNEDTEENRAKHLRKLQFVSLLSKLDKFMVERAMSPGAIWKEKLQKQVLQAEVDPAKMQEILETQLRNSIFGTDEDKDMVMAMLEQLKLDTFNRRVKDLKDNAVLLEMVN